MSEPTRGRILFMSGSAGLGHVTRDVAIAREIRSLVRDADIRWLASSPAKEYLREAGEELLPEAESWADLTSAAEAMATPGKLNITEWAMGVRKAWAGNARLYFEIMAGGDFDVAIGDETYELPIALSRDGNLPRYPLLIIYDFIGLDRVTRSPKELVGNLVLNWLWSRCRSSIGFRAILLGEHEDIPNRRFGPFLSNRRAFARENAPAVGYALSFDPADYTDPQSLKSELGYRPGPLVACTIGGTAVGKELLELCARAQPWLLRARPDLQMVLFCGPRIPVEDIDAPESVEVRGFVPDLFRHLAACDVVVTQAGGTTTLELTALHRPFLYFPLQDHSEQMKAVTGRLRRHGVGEPLLLSRTTPEQLAERVLALMDVPVHYADVPLAGAREAARIAVGMLGDVRPGSFGS